MGLPAYNNDNPRLKSAWANPDDENATNNPPDSNNNNQTRRHDTQPPLQHHTQQHTQPDHANVVVAVRVRPLSQSEQMAGDTECVRKTPNEPQLVIGARRAFTFDHVLDTDAEQADVYHAGIDALVDAVLSGYNSTALAYGQTGSGKTYTMGSAATLPDAAAAADAPESLGLIPRAVTELFRRVHEAPGDAACTVRASFIEIYKEDVRDLMQPPPTAAATTSTDGSSRLTASNPSAFGGGREKEPKLEAESAWATLVMRDDPSGGVTLPGLTHRDVGSLQDAMAVLEEGSRNRATGSTAMNATSSRSHAIFTLSLSLRLPSGLVVTPRLNFVDLAGSERAKRTGASGERLQEGIQINKGLLALGNVINALCEKQSHVRDARVPRAPRAPRAGRRRRPRRAR